jgi:hypothetical protein
VKDSTGEIHRAVEQYLKTPEHDHDVYCIGVWIDYESGYIIVILSTRALLFNMYLLDIVPGMVRADQLDDTHGTNKHRYPLCVFGGTDPGQHFRNYGFALTNRCTAAAYEFIITKVCDAAEDVVEYFINQQLDTGVAAKPPAHNFESARFTVPSPSSPSPRYIYNPISFGSDKAHAGWAAFQRCVAGVKPEEMVTGRTSTFLTPALQVKAFGEVRY